MLYILEVYRTFSVEYASVISDVMQDIERLFKIPIKNMGVGVSDVLIFCFTLSLKAINVSFKLLF